MLTKALQKIGESLLLFGVADHKSLLRLPDPTGGVALDGRLTAGGLFAGDARCQNVEAHDVAGSVVKNQGEEIEVDNGVQGNGLADLEQGFELAPGMFQRGGERHFRRGDDGIRHRRQDNILLSLKGGEHSYGAGVAFLPERQKKAAGWRAPVAMRRSMLSMNWMPPRAPTAVQFSAAAAQAKSSCRDSGQPCRSP